MEGCSAFVFVVVMVVVVVVVCDESNLKVGAPTAAPTLRMKAGEGREVLRASTRMSEEEVGRPPPPYRTHTALVVVALYETRRVRLSPPPMLTPRAGIHTPPSSSSDTSNSRAELPPLLAPAPPIGSKARELEVVSPPGAKANDTDITPTPPPEVVVAAVAELAAATRGVGPKVRSVKAHQAV